MSLLLSRLSNCVSCRRFSQAISFRTDSEVVSKSIPLFVPSEMKLASPRLVITDRARMEIPKFEAPIYPVGVIGQSRSGKSSFLNCLAAYVTEKEHGVSSDGVEFFKASSSNVPVTKGIDFLTLSLDKGTLLLMDCEGIDEYDEGLSAPLSAINMSFSKVLFMMSRKRGEYLTQILPKLSAIGGDVLADVLYWCTITDLFVTTDSFMELFDLPEMAQVRATFKWYEMFKLRVALSQPDVDTLEELDRIHQKELREGTKLLIDKYNIWGKLDAEKKPIEIDGSQLSGEQFLDFIQKTVDVYNASGKLEVTNAVKKSWFVEQEKFPITIAFNAYKAAMRWAETSPLKIPETKLSMAHSKNKQSAVLEMGDRAVVVPPPGIRKASLDRLEADIKAYFDTLESKNNSRIVQAPDRLLGTKPSASNLGSYRVTDIVFHTSLKEQLAPLVCDYSGDLALGSHDFYRLSGYHSTAANGIGDNVLLKFSTKVLSERLSDGTLDVGSPDDYWPQSDFKVYFDSIHGSASLGNVQFDSYEGAVVSETNTSQVNFTATNSRSESFDFTLKGEISDGNNKAGGEAHYGISKTDTNSTVQTYTANWSLGNIEVVKFTADLEITLTLKRHVVANLTATIFSLGILEAGRKSNYKTVTVRGTLKILIPIVDTKLVLEQ